MLFLLEIRLKSLEAGAEEQLLWCCSGEPLFTQQSVIRAWGLCRTGVDSTDNNSSAATGVKFRCKDTTPVKAQQYLTTFYTAAQNDTISRVISGC